MFEWMNDRINGLVNFIKFLDSYGFKNFFILLYVYVFFELLLYYF